jgi:hypothetical protein
MNFGSLFLDQEINFLFSYVADLFVKVTYCYIVAHSTMTEVTEKFSIIKKNLQIFYVSIID